MTLTEILPTIQALPRTDKLRLIQLLATDVAREEELVAVVADQPWPVWTPYGVGEGAATLLRLLDEDKTTS